MPGFLASTTSSTFLPTISDTAAQQARHIAIRITGREVVIAVLFVVAVIVLLTIPVIWGVVAEATSSAAEKAAPATFFVALGVLCTGLVAGFEILAIVGGSLVGLLVVGFIIDNYLGAAGRAARARTAQRTVTDLFYYGHHVGHPAGASRSRSHQAKPGPDLWLCPRRHVQLPGRPRGGGADPRPVPRPQGRGVGQPRLPPARRPPTLIDVTSMSWSFGGRRVLGMLTDRRKNPLITLEGLRRADHLVNCV
jgi:hypothetical protein